MRNHSGFECRPGCSAARQWVLGAVLVTFAVGASAGIFRDVMEKIGISKPPPQTTAAGGVPTFPRQGYICCNARYDGDSISDTNYAELPFISAGTPVTVLGYGKNRANVDVDGKPMKLSHDDGRKEESLDVWVNKIIIDNDPRPQIAAYPATVQAAIRSGKVTLGMTREQALAAVGYPPTNANMSLDEPVWRMWNSRRGEYQLNFGADGRITTITGDGEVTSHVIYLPPRH